MEEYKIGDTRIFTSLHNYKYKEVCVECPICHKLKWSRIHNGIPTNIRHHDCFLTLPISKITREKMRQSQYKAYSNSEVKMKHSVAMLNRYKDPLEHEKTRQQNIERYKDPNEREKTSIKNKVRWSVIERRTRHSQVMTKIWENPEYKDNTMRATMKSAQMTPNLSETIVGNILNEYFPNLWEYVGDGKIIIGGKSPDYVHCNGIKLAIECFGDYWHNPNLNKKIKYHQTEQGRIEFLAQYGYKTLILWEHEIKTLPNEILFQRVKDFMDKSKEGSF